MRRSTGFTLLELMIVISIAAVLLTIAIPSLRTIQLNSKQADTSTSLYGGLVTAHAEAIIRNVPVTICQRAPNTSPPACATSGGSWTNGWVVKDSNQNLIGVGEPADSAFSITTSNTPLPTLTFQTSGRTTFPNGQTLMFTLCKTGDISFTGRQIEVALNGRVTLSAYQPTVSCP